MGYSALMMELASCGYCAVSITHNDGSADWSPLVGVFDGTLMYDHKEKNRQVLIREKEMAAVVKHVTTQGIFEHFGQDWKEVKMTDNVVVMGHSFGAITVLSSIANIPEAKAGISLDPWFFPKKEDKISCGDKKVVVCMTENWDHEIKTQHFNS